MAVEPVTLTQPSDLAGDIADRELIDAALLVGPVDGSSPGRVIGEPWEPDEAIWWERSPDRSSILVVGAPEVSHVIPLDDGTIRKTRLSLGDFVRWQRRPLDS